MVAGPQDLHAPRAPLARLVLVGRDSHFLSGLQAFWTALTPFSVRNPLPEDDLGMGYLDLSQQVIAALDKNPARRCGLAGRRIDHHALKHAFCPET